MQREARFIVLNALKYFKDQNMAAKWDERFNVYEQTAKVCGVSKSTVQRIEKQAQSSDVLMTPNKTLQKPPITVDSFSIAAIRRIIHQSFYLQEK